MYKLFLFFLFCSIGGSAFANKDTININKQLGIAADLYNQNPDSSLQIAQSALQKAKAINYKKGEGKALTIIGVCFDILGQSEKAMAHFFAAIPIQESINDLQNLSFTFNNIGIAYFYQFEYDNALKYYQRSITIDRELDDESSLAGKLINIGIVYTYKDKFELARQNYEEAIEIAEKTKDSLTISAAYSNLSKIEYHYKKYQKAIFYNEKALNYLGKDAGAIQKINIHNSLANIYIQMGDTENALYHATINLELCKKANTLEREMYAHDVLSQVYEASGNYKEALKSHKNYFRLKDSIITIDKNEKLADANIKYETEKKQKLLEKTQLEKELLNEKRNNQIVVLAVLLAALAFIAFFLYQRNRNKEKYNLLLQEKNKVAEERVSEKELLMGEIHHRVKNNLTIVSNILDLQARNLSDEKAIKAINDCQNRVAAIGLIHQKLYQQNDITSIHLNEYIPTLVETIQSTLSNQQKNIYVQNNIADLKVDVDTSIPLGLLITELLTNCFKYAFVNKKEGLIQVSIKKNDDYLLLKVQDNGIGFNENNETDKSFGLRLIRALCKQLKAELEIISNEGSLFTIKINKFKLYE